jgi:hypothetical protein
MLLAPLTLDFFSQFRTRRLTKIVVHPLILSNQGPELQECRSGPVRRTVAFFLKMRPNAVSALEKSVGSFWPGGRHCPFPVNTGNSSLVALAEANPVLAERQG